MKDDPNAVTLSYDQVKRIVHDHILEGSNPTPNNPPGRPSDPEIDAKIRGVLDDIPSASTRLIGEEIKHSHSTVYRHLTQSMGYHYRCIRWIPHFLNEDQKRTRVQRAKELLTLLHTQDRLKWKFIYTGDESWFFYDNQIKKLWLESDAERPKAERPDILTKKIMVCIFWNPHGIVVIKAMERGHAINSGTFINEILKPIEMSEEFHTAKNQKKSFILHMDNSRVHRSQMVKSYMENNRLKNAPHPPYSPDLAPSDFYLFCKLKSQMIGMEFTSEDELIQWIIGQFSSIPQAELEAVFAEWERRLERCIECDGEYVE